jgi:hypothetical protein
MKSLSRAPDQRPESARAMREELERLATQLGLARGMLAFRPTSSKPASGASGRLVRRTAVAAAAAFSLMAWGSEGKSAHVQGVSAQHGADHAVANEVASWSEALEADAQKDEHAATFTSAFGQVPPALAPVLADAADRTRATTRTQRTASAPPMASARTTDDSALSWHDLMRRALAHYIRGDLEGAQQLYERATHVEPQRAAGWRGLALTAARRHKGDEAKKAFGRYSLLTATDGERQAVGAQLARWNAL